MAKSGLARFFRLLRVHTHRLSSRLRAFIVAAICVLGIAGSMFLFLNDLFSDMERLEAEPVGAVSWVNSTAQRLSEHTVQWDRLTNNSSVYDGDIISTAAFSNIKINFVNGQTLELAENTSIRIESQNNTVSHIELLQGEIQIICKWLNMTISCDESTREVLAGTALKLHKDRFFQKDPLIKMLSPGNGTRILRTSPEEAPVKFQWQELPDKANATRTTDTTKTDKTRVVLYIAETRDFSRQLGSWPVDSDSTEIALATGAFFWKLLEFDTNNELDSGHFDIILTQNPRPISPADGSVQTFLPGKQSLHFSWTVPIEAESVLLEVADNPEMSRPRLRQLINKTTNGRGLYTSSRLAPGQWYWRIYPIYPGGITRRAYSSSMGISDGYWRVRSANTDILTDDLPSAVNAFVVVEEAAPSVPEAPPRIPVQTETGTIPRLIFPPDNYTLESNRTPDLLFTWKNSLTFNNRFQISERLDFAGSFVMDMAVADFNTRIPFLKPGIYYWRVSGADIPDSPPSLPSRIVIIPALPAPRLITPRENENIQFKEINEVNFSWERLNYAPNYAFSLFLEGKDEPIAEILALQNNSVMVYFDTNTQGRFHWTVQGYVPPSAAASGRRGIIAQGKFSIVPQSGRIQENANTWTTPTIANINTYSGEVSSPITLLSPAAGISIAGAQALRNPPEARWSVTEPLTNIELILSTTTDPINDPQAIHVRVSGSPAVFPPLGDGIWYWLIRGDTAASRGVTSGEPFWIRVLPLPLLTPPRIARPGNNAVIDIAQLTRDRNITFTWEPVNGANAYIFSLFQEGNPPVNVITAAPQSELSYVLDNLSILEEGTFLWQVEAIQRNSNGVIDQRGRIEQHSFTIEIRSSGNVRRISE